MRMLAILAAAFFLCTCGFAQEVFLSREISRDARVHYHNRFPTSADVATVPQRHWYWEDTSYSGLPPNPIERAALYQAYNDFSPVSLSWTLEGKHRLLPTFDLVGFDMKPGSQRAKPDSEYGSLQNPRLWIRASHAVRAALRY